MECSQLIRDILRKRGVTTPADVEEFLSDHPRRTYDPFLLKDMEAGVSLLLSEAAAGHRIMVYGDYDADGITATTLMLSVLSHITKPGQVDYYIPSRFGEGYGLNVEAVEEIAHRGFHMLLTVDCGCVSKKEVERARELGMSVLVTDHHNVDLDTRADCLLIDPKQPDCHYPFPHLAGVGVAFKLAQALQQRAGLPKAALTEVLDLVAIGTVGDIMPLVDENRTMVKFGLRLIALGRRAGLAALIRGVSLDPAHITSENISYIIVPHLNASGRIQDATTAVELLRCAAPPADAAGAAAMQEKVETLIERNTRRKALQQETFHLCADMVDARIAAQGEPDDLILLEVPDAHEGIAGIVAGKVREAYDRPTILVTRSGENGDCWKGTGRSVPRVDLHRLLQGSEDLFLKFGGHAAACGFLIPDANLPVLRERLRTEMRNLRAADPNLFARAYDVDLSVRAADLSLALAAEMEKLAPFGRDNPEPLLSLSPVWIGDVRYMGEQGQHVRFAAWDAGGQGPSDGRWQAGGRIACVLFNEAARYEQALQAGGPLTVIGSLQRQTWQGQERLQFLVKTIEPAT